MQIIDYNLPSSDLASRKLAIIERSKIESYIVNQDALIKLDMSNVASISESYSDELFGVLVKRYGSDTILSSINLLNTKEHILLSIAQVINRRAKEYSII